jgi:hypothetical protein
MQPNGLLEPSPGRDGFLVPPRVRVENELRALNGLGTFDPPTSLENSGPSHLHPQNP